jgi:chromosome segregation ATPase
MQADYTKMGHEKLMHEINNLTETWRERRTELTVLHMEMRELKGKLEACTKAEYELWAHLAELRQAMRTLDENRPVLEYAEDSRASGPAEGMMNPQARW